MLRAVPVTSLTLTTTDGCSLDADLACPDEAVRAAAVVCHPHPLYGGNRRNPVVDALFRALPAIGVAALRFDFRGVGRSTGGHGRGVDEALDVTAALDELATRWPSLPLLATGYSFGSMVVLSVVDDRVAAWVAVAPPLRGSMAVDASGVAADHRPKLVLAAQHDQYTTAAAAREVCASWTATNVVEVPNADHFLAERTAWVAEQASAWVEDLLNR